MKYSPNLFEQTQEIKNDMNFSSKMFSIVVELQKESRGNR
jgi:hypothetical protein